MKLVLGFPFKLFVYRFGNCVCYRFKGTDPSVFIYCSVMFFCLAILSRCIQYGAVVQLAFAGIFGVLVFFWLISCWLITEPRDDINSSDRQQQAICEAAPSAHGSPCHFPPPQPC